MSISQAEDRVKIPNPATKVLKYSPSDGDFKEYNSETKEKVSHNKIKVLVLDIVSQIAGWDSVTDTSIYSNQIHNSTSEEMYVRNGNGDVLAKGLYSAIKVGIKDRGAKFNSIFYCLLLKDDLVDSLIRVAFQGAGLTSIVEAKIRAGDFLEIEKGEQQKKGSVKFYVPKVTKVERNNDLLEVGKKIDREQLVPYFESLKYTPKEVIEEAVVKTLTSQTQNKLPEINLEDINVAMPF